MTADGANGSRTDGAKQQMNRLEGGPSEPPSVLVAREGTRIPVPGGKLIEELIGRVATGTDGFSLAHMVAPPGWIEPPQTPEFGELTLVVRGRLAVHAVGEERTVATGQAIYTGPGERVRYGNPFDEEAEYYAVCWPAFSPDRAVRDGDDSADGGDEG